MKMSLCRSKLWLRSVGIALLTLVSCQACSYDAPKGVHLPPTTLGEADLRFGASQVDQMIHDRPEMRKCVERGDVIYTWVARQFAGEETKQRFYWSPRIMDGTSKCQDSPSGYFTLEDGKTPIISVAEDYCVGQAMQKRMTCELLWRYVVYEIYNVRNLESVRSYYADALSGNLSKKNWMNNCVRAEFNATQQSKQFYRDYWRPWAKAKGMTTDESYWFMDEPSDYSMWIKQTQSARYLTNYYAKYYDGEIAPHVKR